MDIPRDHSPCVTHAGVEENKEGTREKARNEQGAAERNPSADDPCTAHCLTETAGRKNKLRQGENRESRVARGEKRHLIKLSLEKGRKDVSLSGFYAFFFHQYTN